MMNFISGFIAGVFCNSAYFVYRISRTLNRKPKSAQRYVDKLKAAKGGEGRLEAMKEFEAKMREGPGGFGSVDASGGGE